MKTVLWPGSERPFKSNCSATPVELRYYSHD